jgi:threonine/homoserine/homoserine lactone efflux protein
LPDTQFLLFVTASLVVIVAPGPDNILVLTRGITLGRNAAMVSAAGASLGLVCHSVLAAVGLSALLLQSAAAFSVVKYAGRRI